jgi:hypothetical protein
MSSSRLAGSPSKRVEADAQDSPVHLESAFEDVAVREHPLERVSGGDLEL